MTAVIETPRVSWAPDQRIARIVKANDAALPAKKSEGLNCADFDDLFVYVTLLNGATAATVEPHFWSSFKDGTPNGGFVPEATPQVITATAAGVVKRIKVHHQGSVFFEVTGIAGGLATDERVRVEVSGVPVYGQAGG